MKIGDRIRRARLEAGMSQRALATALGVTHGIVGQWESHRKNPGRDNVRRIAEVTLTSVEALLYDADARPSGPVLVSDPQIRDILRLIMPLSPREKDNLLEFLKMRANIGREREDGHGTPHRKPVTHKLR